MGATRLALAVGAMLLAGSQFAIAGEFKQASQSTVRNNPYSKLFQPSDTKTPSADAAAAADKGKPRVVCGMTLIPVDPIVDPKMLRVVPQPSDTRYTIRAITPPVCK